MQFYILPRIQLNETLLMALGIVFPRSNSELLDIKKTVSLVKHVSKLLTTILILECQETQQGKTNFEHEHAALFWI